MPDSAFALSQSRSVSSWTWLNSKPMDWVYELRSFWIASQPLETPAGA